MKKHLIKQKDKTRIINVSDIIYCSSSGNYSIIHMEGQKPITVSKCLKKISNELDGNFIRISQSYLVNIDYILEIDPQNHHILLSSGVFLDFTLKYSALCNILETKLKFSGSQYDKGITK